MPKSARLPEELQARELLEFQKYLEQGRAEVAFDCAYRTYLTASEADNEILGGVALADLGRAAVLLGKTEGMAGLVESWLDLSNDDYVRFRLSLTMALHYGRAEVNYQEMARFSRQALFHAERFGTIPGQASVLSEIGASRVMVGDLLGATEAAYQALELLAYLPDRESRAPAHLTLLGYCLSQIGDMSTAVRALARAAGHARVSGSASVELPARVYMANSMLEIGRPRDAEFHLHRAIRLARVVSFAEDWMPKILYLLGDSLKAQRRSKEALEVFQYVENGSGPEGLAHTLMDGDARRKIDIF